MMTRLLWRHLFPEHSLSIYYSLHHGLLFRHTSSRHLLKLDMTVDDSVHWISWKTGVPNNVWNLHAPAGPHESTSSGNRGNMLARSFLIYNALSAVRELHTVHQSCIAGLVKHLLPYIWRISEWISFASSVFAQKNTNNNMMFLTERLQRQRRHIWCF